MDANSSLKKYLKPKWSTIWIGVVLLAIAVFVGIFGTGDAGVIDIVFTVLFIALAVAIFGVAIAAFVNFSKEMKRLEEEGLYEQMEYEFAAAVQYFSDKLRLGDGCVFPRYGGKVLRYEDIAKVYQYIHKTNGVENDRELRAATSAGKVVTLSKIALRGKDDDEVNKAVAALLEKNPSIHPGYK